MKGNRVFWPPPYAADCAFREVTAMALRYRRGDAGGLYAELLALLADCEPDPDGYPTSGATYRQLALIGHTVGMDYDQRRGWYDVAETIGLTHRHAGHIIARIQDGSFDRARDETATGAGNVVRVVFGR